MEQECTWSAGGICAGLHERLGTRVHMECRWDECRTARALGNKGAYEVQVGWVQDCTHVGKVQGCNHVGYARATALAYNLG